MLHPEMVALAGSRRHGEGDRRTLLERSDCGGAVPAVFQNLHEAAAGIEQHPRLVIGIELKRVVTRGRRLQVSVPRRGKIIRQVIRRDDHPAGRAIQPVEIHGGIHAGDDRGMRETGDADLARHGSRLRSRHGNARDRHGEAHPGAERRHDIDQRTVEDIIELAGREGHIHLIAHGEGRRARVGDGRSAGRRGEFRVGVSGDRAEVFRAAVGRAGGVVIPREQAGPRRRGGLVDDHRRPVRSAERERKRHRAGCVEQSRHGSTALHGRLGNRSDNNIGRGRAPRRKRHGAGQRRVVHSGHRRAADAIVDRNRKQVLRARHRHPPRGRSVFGCEGGGRGNRHQIRERDLLVHIGEIVSPGNGLGCIRIQAHRALRPVAHPVAVGIDVLHQQTEKLVGRGRDRQGLRRAGSVPDNARIRKCARHAGCPLHHVLFPVFRGKREVHRGRVARDVRNSHVRTRIKWIRPGGDFGLVRLAVSIGVLAQPGAAGHLRVGDAIF